MTIPADFPLVYSNYKVEISFNNEKEKKSLIEAIAERVSTIYASLLKEETHLKRSKDEEKSKINFYSELPTKFPSQKEVESFQKDLKRTIVNTFIDDESCIDLSTNYFPVGDLYQVLKRNGILSDHRNFYQLFPEKSLTSILIRKDKKISIRMR